MVLTQNIFPMFILFGSRFTLVFVLRFSIVFLEIWVHKKRESFPKRSRLLCVCEDFFLCLGNSSYLFMSTGFSFECLCFLPTHNNCG